VGWPPAWESVNWNESSVVGYLLDSNDMSMVAEESLLLRSITKTQLVEAD
jgi:hypothetical protein